MKLNGWTQVVVLLFSIMGMVTWIITADTRLHNRCDQVDRKAEKVADIERQHHLEVVVEVGEIKGDVKVIREILEMKYPEIARKAAQNDYNAEK